MQVFEIINNVGTKINADMNVKNWFIKELVIKDLFRIQVIMYLNVNLIRWKYFDYSNCKCRKRLAYKLVEECSENIDEVKIARTTLAEHENKYENECKRSCTLCYFLCFQ